MLRPNLGQLILLSNFLFSEVKRVVEYIDCVRTKGEVEPVVCADCDGSVLDADDAHAFDP